MYWKEEIAREREVPCCDLLLKEVRTMVINGNGHYEEEKKSIKRKVVGLELSGVDEVFIMDSKRHEGLMLHKGLSL